MPDDWMQIIVQGPSSTGWDIINYLRRDLRFHYVDRCDLERDDFSRASYANCEALTSSAFHSDGGSMATACPSCEHKFLSPADIGDLLSDARPWWRWEGQPNGESVTLANGLIATKIAGRRSDWTDDDASYARQGEVDPVWMVFEVAGKLYKKTGLASSYGDAEWLGSVTEVQAKEKTVTIYEYEA